MRLPQIKTLAFITGVIALVLVNTGCGKSIVTKATISTPIQNGDQWAMMDIQFKTNGISLPTMTLPIFDPTHPSSSFGDIAMSMVTTGVGDVKLDLNLTSIAKLPSGDALLPNGSTVPIVAVDGVKIVQIPIPSTKFQLYVAVQLDVVNPANAPVLMVGLAMPFVQFDPIGQNLGNVDLFIPFNIKGVLGTAGLFAGKESGTSGIGLFVDFGGLIPQPATPAPATRLGYYHRTPGKRAEMKIKKMIKKMGDDRVQLTID